MIGSGSLRAKGKEMVENVMFGEKQKGLDMKRELELWCWTRIGHSDNKMKQGGAAEKRQDGRYADTMSSRRDQKHGGGGRSENFI